MEFLEKLFDKYNRIARVYPALLAIAPIVWSVTVVFPKTTNDLGSGAASVALAACLLFLLSSFARSRGKTAEQNLLAKWGGWPTTIFLRHRDPTVDRTTKARYHQAISELCGGLVFPSEDAEAQAPQRADEIYRSATKKLIESRRDPKYGLVHSENASYGFRRNLYGMRPLIIVISIACLFFTLGAIWLLGSGSPAPVTFVKSALTHRELTACAAIDLAYLFFCLWIVREEFVHQGARDYALALLRTLD